MGNLSRIKDRFPHAGLFVILAVFLVLTTLYSIVVPITQGGDELAHYRYLKFIAETGRLPINEVEREQAWYRADWPPLYHLLVGWAVSPLDTTRPYLKDVGESPHRRLVGKIFFPRLIIYIEDVDWPWQDGILAWHLGRFISILFAAGALIFTWLTARELCRHVKDQSLSLPCSPVPLLSLAVTATALLAFMPRFLFTSAMLGDDSLFVLLSAIFIWLLLRALRGSDGWWIYAVLGLLLGLSIATKYSTGLFPLVIIPVVWWRGQRVDWRWWQSLGRIAVTWLATIIGASWWFAWLGYYFNSVEEDGPILGVLNAWLNTGPDVSMKKFFALFSGQAFTGPERPGAVAAGTFWDWLVYLFQTFWGELVLEHDPFFPWMYLLVLVFCLLSFIGLWRLWRVAQGETQITLAVLVLIIALLFPFPIVRFFLTHNVLETGQGRHILYPAAQATPILLMLGWAMFNLKTSSVQRFILHALPPIFLLLWSGLQLGYMAFTYPAPLPVQTTTFNLTSVPHPLKHNFGDDIQLLGYDAAFDVEQGLYNVTLFWRALDRVDENYRVQVQLVDSSSQPHLTWLSHPVDGLYPTRAWDKGDVIRDKIFLPLIGLPPDSYTVQVNLLRQAEDTPLVDKALALTTFVLPTRQSLVGAIPLGQFEYRLWPDDAVARHRQPVMLAWRGDDETQPAWTLLDPDNVTRNPVATGDGAAVFMVAADWPSGDYRLQLQHGSETLQTDSVLTVANETRQFTLEPVPEGFVPVEAVFANVAGQPQFKLLGYVLPTRRIEPGGGLPLTVYWQSLNPVLADTLTFAVLLDDKLESYGSIDRYPAGFYSPILWAQNEVVADDFIVPVRPDAPPGIYALHLGQYKLIDGQPQSLNLMHNGQPTDETAVAVGPLKVGGPPSGVTTENPKPQIMLNQPFDNQITLLGYDMNIEDSALHLTLYWQAETNLQTDYTTFFHLRNAANENVAQKDSPPAAGRYPTSLWNTGEIIVDEIVVPLDGVSPGRYTPVVGLYELATGNRLVVPGIPANEVALEPIQVKE